MNSPQKTKSTGPVPSAAQSSADADGKINLSTVFAGQNVGIKQISEQVWLVSFMQYDLGFFDSETDRVTSAENPFGAKVLPMCPE
jgi:putative transposase